eukprot:TRINITY_DN103_c0_g1_i6.p1 TRINITY_DN103_c0_g1~~TRINITY_DN103_c0_g1_i6.p1  ORF type:complete len:335 (+),score=96.73 TRINITY_DN103_c0_g1_i6:120-1124(+)
MKFSAAILLLALAVTAAAAKPHVRASFTHLSDAVLDKPAIDADMVKEINAKKTTWTATTENPIAKMTLRQAKGRCGVLPGGPKLPTLPKAMVKEGEIPKEFESDKQWPNCPTIQQIRDQSACGSCWAFSSVESMSDRLCIHGVAQNVSLSSAEMAFCCASCGQGCDGGYPIAAWQYWVDNGLGPTTCDPYPFPSCDHHIPNSPNPCPPSIYPNPPCKDQKCTDRYYGATAYQVSSDVASIQKEVMTNGPVVATYTVYQDFLSYKSGVYKHESGPAVGGHAVKIVGWGELNGTPYWKIANSWNPDWGLNGYFLILRGQDECGIESGISAGMPKSR